MLVRKKQAFLLEEACTDRKLSIVSSMEEIKQRVLENYENEGRFCGNQSHFFEKVRQCPSKLFPRQR